MCDGTYAVSAEQSTIVVVGSNNIYPEGIRTELLASISTPSEQSYLMVDVVGMAAASSSVAWAGVVSPATPGAPATAASPTSLVLSPRGSPLMLKICCVKSHPAFGGLRTSSAAAPPSQTLVMNRLATKLLTPVPVASLALQAPKSR